MNRPHDRSCDGRCDKALQWRNWSALWFVMWVLTAAALSDMLVKAGIRGTAKVEDGTHDIKQG